GVEPLYQYINLDLWIERGADGAYVVRAKSPQGDFQEKATGDPAGLGAHDRKMADNTADAGYVKDIGGRQYRFIFASAIQRLLDRCLGSTGEECGVRIRLQLASDNPEIAAIPWEFLFDDALGGFIASCEKTPVVRFIETNHAMRPPEARMPLRMLVVIPTVEKLDLEGEKRRINEALEKIDPPVDVKFLEGNVTRTALSDALTAQHVDILHFVGHGDFQDGKGRLRLNQSLLEPDWIEQEALGELVKNHHDLKLIVLNTCQGAEVSSSEAFGGIGPHLVLAGVPAVVAMQFPITDKEALDFVHAFYFALFQGTERGSVDSAITSARSALSRDFQGTRAVGLPVLFMRYNEGVLFQKDTGSKLKDAPFAPAEFGKAQAFVKDAETTLAGMQDPAHPAAPEAVAEQKEILARARARIRFRNWAIAVPAAMFLLTAMAAAIGLFDRMSGSLGWIVAASPVWFGDPLAKSLPVDSIAIVTISTPIDATWRPRHAEVIDRLSRAGARVVAFDIRFQNQTPADSLIVRAADSARARGTMVVDGADSLRDGALALSPPLARHVTPGMDCLAEHPFLFSGVVPLVWARNDTSALLPAFSLATVAAWYKVRFAGDLPRKEILISGRGQVADHIRLTKVTHLLTSQARCPIMTAGSRYGELLSVRAPLEKWRDPARRFDYAAVLAAPPERLAWARGRIVLIGSLDSTEIMEVRAGIRHEKRYGVERHADAIATMLANVEPRPAGGGVVYGLMALMAAIGALLAYRGKRPRRVQAVLRVSIPLVGLALLSTLLYRSSHTLLNVLYPAAVLLATYISLLLLRRRLLP
ncbi:MAG TPA: CHAT domain-containing protein, partial [Gemmatimonadales bacterium]|nr:CHAT domain-containing protein [Gemmatimonadales bacterium]